MGYALECFGFVGVLNRGIWLAEYGGCLGCYSNMPYVIYLERVIIAYLKG